MMATSESKQQELESHEAMELAYNLSYWNGETADEYAAPKYSEAVIGGAQLSSERARSYVRILRPVLNMMKNPTEDDIKKVEVRSAILACHTAMNENVRYLRFHTTVPADSIWSPLVSDFWPQSMVDLRNWISHDFMVPGRGYSWEHEVFQIPARFYEERVPAIEMMLAAVEQALNDESIWTPFPEPEIEPALNAEIISPLMALPPEPDTVSVKRNTKLEAPEGLLKRSRTKTIGLVRAVKSKCRRLRNFHFSVNIHFSFPEVTSKEFSELPTWKVDTQDDNEKDWKAVEDEKLSVVFDEEGWAKGDEQDRESETDHVEW
ncbi:uncharacterized protein EI97DRAFT_504437 [Westerdykella ornata]|uniref:Uncharacterized protein n=1 Tax=Westerdykella ornata TaxID=318751 RepID=A0A6A6J7L5_WESOR|nr:uncharacterized protein EI97DRAFT_504437 [Westerdykella ornata]KAF2272207.1 hypothetical protein EI97DRAFT_504437 [Westerdykella ornata]